MSRKLLISGILSSRKGWFKKRVFFYLEKDVVLWKNFIFVLEKSKENCYLKRSSTLCCTVLFDYKGAEQHLKLNRKLLISRVATLKTRLLFKRKFLSTWNGCCYLKEHQSSLNLSSKKGWELKRRFPFIWKRTLSFERSLYFSLKNQKRMVIWKEGSLLFEKGCGPLWKNIVLFLEKSRKNCCLKGRLPFIWERMLSFERTSYFSLENSKENCYYSKEVLHLHSSKAI